MSRFLQLHLLTFFPPANMNRDDTGRPKTAVVGGATRLRLSSQALKRAWRTSPVFVEALAGHMGSRTQRMGEEIQKHLLAQGRSAELSAKIARQLAEVFGKVKSEKDPNPSRIEQLAFISPEERTSVLAWAERLAEGEKTGPKPEEILRRDDTAGDIALFGRMLADNPAFNREAAAQVAHAITTHRVAVEDDYYTAVDDLKRPEEDAGAGFLGEAAFGSGVFYLYICVNRELLARNLGGDSSLAATCVAALVESAATTAPKGKQASYAAHGRAHYILAEKGSTQPRTLAGAFARPVESKDVMAGSVEALRDFRGALDQAYGRGADSEAEMEVGVKGTLAEIVAFCRA